MVELRSAVLVIDDNRRTGGGLSDSLREIGFVNLVEDDGSGALRLLRSRPFAFVVANETAPRIAGLDLVRLIRTAPDLAKTRIILIGDKAEAARQQLAAEAGVDFYLARPFTLEALRSAIHSALASPSTRPGETNAAPGERQPMTGQTLLPDHVPMLPMFENAVELRSIYGNLTPQPGSKDAPWQVALRDWWQFVRRREGMAADGSRAAGKR